ncbi:MAG: hypothetical protein JNL82_31190 [Myxococcales bacterium]|nr:hypothetical protein [Myxococcales bacterium]
MRHQAIDHCDILDVLEEAAIFRKPVEVELRDRHRFTARVRDVYTADGEDFVVFEDGDPMSVAEITQCQTSADVVP